MTATATIATATPQSDLAKRIAARAKDRVGGIKQVSEGRSDINRVNPYLLEVEDNFNARDFDNPEVKAHIDGLARSISKGGVQRPLKVRNKGGRFVVRDGECRLRATFRAIEEYGAEILTVPVVLQGREVSEEDDVLSLLVENSGLNLTPLEQGSVFKRLKGFGMSVNDIADRAGVTATRVTQLLELQGVPEEAKKMIREGKLSATLVGQVARDCEFDGDTIVTTLTNALVAAEQSGKKKATARHISGTKTNLRRDLKAIFEATTHEEIVEEGEVVEVVVAFSAADYAKIRELLKL
jgi:ParB/RepB/Spo0J family partition protein